MGLEDCYDRLRGCYSRRLSTTMLTHTIRVLASKIPIDRSDEPKARNRPSGLIIVINVNEDRSRLGYAPDVKTSHAPVSDFAVFIYCPCFCIPAADERLPRKIF